MNKTWIALIAVTMGSLFSGSAQAACGGGGYTISSAAPTQTKSSRNNVDADSKVGDLRRDVEKAQRKLDQCVGECDRERQKLEEAERKLAKRVTEVSGR